MLGFRYNLESLDEVCPPAGIVIRPARLPEEIKLIDRLGNEAFDDPLNQGEHINEETHLQIEMATTGFQCEQFIIAQQKERPVGYPVIEKNYDIVEVGVVPKWRRKGIGTALLLSALHWIKKVNACAAFIKSIYFFTKPI